MNGKLIRCPKCKETKPPVAFSEHTKRANGKQVYCKECRRKWRVANRGELLRRNRDYNQKHREQQIEAERARHKKNPKQRKCRHAVRYAIQTGAIVQGPCEFSDSSCCGAVHAHHDDYDKPLDVRWMCRSHHKRHHDWRRTA